MRSNNAKIELNWNKFTRTIHKSYKPKNSYVEGVKDGVTLPWKLRYHILFAAPLYWRTLRSRWTHAKREQLTLSVDVTFHVKLRWFPEELKFAPIGRFRTLKIMAESLSKAVTFKWKTSPRVTSTHSGTSVKFGGKLPMKQANRFTTYNRRGP